MDYFTLLTNLGAQKIAAAMAANTTIDLTEIAIGDGNGAVPVPNITQTALVHEVFRTELSELKVDAVNTNQIIARAVIPASEGNFWVREVGIFDADGDLIAVGNYPETYKSILTQGAAKEIDLMVVFEVANTEVVQLVIDPSIVMASQEYVNGKVANKAESNHNHDTTYAKLGGLNNQKFKVGDAEEDDDAVNKKQLNNAIFSIQTLPIGAILQGYTIFSNCIVAFGGEFNRADYPKLWAYLQANPSLVKTESQWQDEATANGGICGFFSSGSGGTTFRVPNVDKAFLRPDSRGIASYQADDFKSHIHGMVAATGASGTTSVVMSSNGTGVISNQNTNTKGGDETRPKNVAVLPLIVAK